MKYQHQKTEELLYQFREVLAGDYERYSNHVCRVFTYCLLMDKDKANEEKYAIAAAFHDIGIWTDHTFDYLEPSVKQVKRYLSDTGKQHWTDEIVGMIYWHHKLSAYNGQYRETVENFRKADWMDVSLGFLTFGADKRRLKDVRSQFPNAGFHLFLLKQSIKNFFKHPLNPLPVFKR